MVIDICRIESWDASKHTGSVYSDATHRKYKVSKSAFGRISREPMVGDTIIIDKLSAKLVGTVEVARIRGLEPKKSNLGAILLLILLIAAALFVWKSGVLNSFSVVKTDTPVKMEAPSLLNR